MVGISPEAKDKGKLYLGPEIELKMATRARLKPAPPAAT